ncbi:hypothetical protein CTI14_06225 [Methylobacterium radiotolerans]|nr:hypothetical protein CTI14_06225 [Methylobacterium radiotolerans]
MTLQKIRERQEAFAAGLPEDREAAMVIASAPGGACFYVADMQAISAELISFRGFDDDGEAVEVVQHASQCNVMFLPIRKAAARGARLQARHGVVRWTGAARRRLATGARARQGRASTTTSPQMMQRRFADANLHLWSFDKRHPERASSASRSSACSGRTTSTRSAAATAPGTPRRRPTSQRSRGAPNR